MKTIILREEYIKLGQALKAAGLVDSGVEAKIHIAAGEVQERRGRKLYDGDMVAFGGETIKIQK